MSSNQQDSSNDSSDTCNCEKPEIDVYTESKKLRHDIGFIKLSRDQKLELAGKIKILEKIEFSGVTIPNPVNIPADRRCEQKEVCTNLEECERARNNLQENIQTLNSDLMGIEDCDQDLTESENMKQLMARLKNSPNKLNNIPDESVLKDLEITKEKLVELQDKLEERVENIRNEDYLTKLGIRKAPLVDPHEEVSLIEDRFKELAARLHTTIERRQTEFESETQSNEESETQSNEESETQSNEESETQKKTKSHGRRM